MVESNDAFEGKVLEVLELSCRTPGLCQSIVYYYCCGPSSQHIHMLELSPGIQKVKTSIDRYCFLFMRSFL